MTRAIRVLGIDPGPAPGLLLACWHPGWKRVTLAQAYQCDAASAPGLLRMLLNQLEPVCWAGQAEEFRAGHGAGTRGRAAAVTRAQVTTLAAAAEEAGVPVVMRHSSAVFPWASDARLKAAGLWDVTAGLKDARSAARHALFRAVHDCGVPDPLSREGRS